MKSNETRALYLQLLEAARSGARTLYPQKTTPSTEADSAWARPQLERAAHR